jgi:hypothetical protein
MRSLADRDAASKLREAIELYDLGLAMMRQNLQRRFPDECDARIERRLLEWRLDRADAPDGDGEGTLVPFPRPRR